MSETELMNLMLFGVNLFLLVFIAAFIAITPVITRKTLLFGVRIPEAVVDHPKVKGLKQRFITIVLLCGAVLAVLLAAQYLFAPEWSLLACLYFPMALVAVQFLSYLPCWKKAKELKEQHGWASVSPATAETRTASERSKLVSFPIIAYVLSLGLVLVSIVWSAAIYPALPAVIPTHWNISMQPDAWGAKSLWTGFGMPLIAIATIAVMAVSNGALYKTKLQISAEDPQKSYAQHRMYRKMMSRALGVITVVISLFFTVMQLMSIGVLTPPTWFMFTMTFVLLAACIAPPVYVSLKAGQSGNRLNPPAEYYSAAPPATAAVRPVHPGRGDDRYWKLGLFYYNPEDPAILVEDRFGSNSSMNYARIPALVFVALMFLLIAGLYIGMTWLYFSGAL